MWNFMRCFFQVFYHVVHVKASLGQKYQDELVILCIYRLHQYIADNGRLISQLLDFSVGAWPVLIDDFVEYARPVVTGGKHKTS